MHLYKVYDFIKIVFTFVHISKIFSSCISKPSILFEILARNPRYFENICRM